MIDGDSIVAFMRERAYKPMTFQELAEVFGEEGSADRLSGLLSTLEHDGAVVRTRTARYGVPERMDLVVGRLQVKSRGFGFVIPLNGVDPDVFVDAADLGGAMDGDRVIVRPYRESGGARREGEIVRILHRAHETLVGVLSTHGGFGFVKPDDKHLHQDVFIPGEGLRGAVDGQKVVAELLDYPGKGVQSATGRIVEILGFPNDPGVDILSVVRKYGLPERFPQEVLESAEGVPAAVTERDLTGRRDLRSETIVTIDGEDAKDLDDAVHVTPLDNGNVLLGVHIADVSYYVREGSELDAEAFRRGTSTYLVDRVIPMLPPRLSNGICSLNPRSDRLTLTCEMEWTPDMRLARYEIYPSVIRTAERMTYSDVNRLLRGESPELEERHRELLPRFRRMEELMKRLRARRMERGAVDFDFAETKMKLDERGHPVEILRRERSAAEMLIEEFMLAANETVAEHFHWLDVPFLYRVHEPPSLEKMVALNEFVHNLGHKIRGIGSKIHPSSLQELLEKVRGEKEEIVISHVMLRSLRQARYSHQSLGHFGLAAPYYTHFTSPIRRYPDLVVHRIIREVLFDGGLTPQRRDQLERRMPEIAAQSSERERNAVDAERETDLLKKVEFMMDKVGEEFEGMISGVTSFGLFVQLDNSVEGLVHISYLTDDYYHFHEKAHALIGERLKRTFRIGDRVLVRVIGANKEQLQIDFDLLESLDEGGPDWTEELEVPAGPPGRGGDRRGYSAGRGGRKRESAAATGRESAIWTAKGVAGPKKGRKSLDKAGRRPGAGVRAGFGPKGGAPEAGTLASRAGKSGGGAWAGQEGAAESGGGEKARRKRRVKGRVVRERAEKDSPEKKRPAPEAEGSREGKGRRKGSPAGPGKEPGPGREAKKAGKKKRAAKDAGQILTGGPGIAAPQSGYRAGTLTEPGREVLPAVQARKAALEGAGFKNGALKTGPLESESPRNGSLKTGVLESGSPRNGPLESGSPEDGFPRNGALEKSALEKSAVRPKKGRRKKRTSGDGNGSEAERVRKRLQRVGILVEGTGSGKGPSAPAGPDATAPGFLEGPEARGSLNVEQSGRRKKSRKTAGPTADSKAVPSAAVSGVKKEKARGLLPAKGGYVTASPDDRGPDRGSKIRRRKEKAALKDIAETYGAKVKDKGPKV